MPDARGGRRTGVRVEAPQLPARRGVEREDAKLRRRAIEHAVHDDRIGLHLRAGEFVVGRVRPRHRQPLDVGRRDLAEGGVVRVIVAAAVDRPVHVLRAGARSGAGEQQGNGER